MIQMSKHFPHLILNEGPFDVDLLDMLNKQLCVVFVHLGADIENSDFFSQNKQTAVK